MAFFLPSYFQKRLLRYALTRLDFIETDELDLEDLDITFGQRSVVELKNVGIKVARLIERLQLPPTLVLDHAIIRRLRITVPADLHVSGIVVEVDGVDVQVEIQGEEEDNAVRAQPGLTPSHKDVANRSRLASPSQHDPGGKRGGKRFDHNEIGHVIPTSRDLAMSFLETEPQQEKEELEAVLQTQSQFMHESTASLASTAEESGLGMPGGFSLPGFVASFFAGVADRLSVIIKNVDIMVGMKLPSDGSPAETVKLLLRFADLSLDTVVIASEAATPQSQRRQITFTGFETLLLSEPEAFSQHSTVSSPKLSKSRSKASSSTFSSENLSQFESPESRLSDIEFHPTLPNESRQYLPRQDSNLSQNSSSSSELADLRPDIGDSFLGSSRLLHRSNNGFSGIDVPQERDDTESNVSIDNQENAIRSLEPRTYVPPVETPTISSPGAVEDLTQSKMFTHDQAESMYMSAISESPAQHGMPGSWDSSDDNVLEQRLDTIPESSTPKQSSMPISASTASLSPSQTSRPDPAEDLQLKDEATRDFGAEFLQNANKFSNLIAKRLVMIDIVTIRIPTEKKDGLDDGSRLSTQSVTQLHSQRPSTYTSRSAQEDVIASHLMQSTHIRTSSHEFVVSSTPPQYEVVIGNVSIALDMSIGRILVKAASAATRIFLPATVEISNPPSPSTNFSAKTKLRSLRLDVCQSVPETSISATHPKTDAESVENSTTQASILRLSLKGLEHHISQNAKNVRQKATIERIVLGQGTEKILCFLDTLNVRDSIATSTIIRSHDFVVTNTDGRYEIQLKPINVVLDLLLMDDVLSRGGGLSSLIDLGNSVISTGTVREKSIAPQTSSSRPRTVRFDSHTSGPKTDKEVQTSGPKIDIRISGAFVNLIGSETSIQLRTSAIKLVSRQMMFRAQIDNAALIGPLLHNSKANADINVKLVNLSLIYLDTPAEEDLDRLLSLLTPSSDKYDEEDDIMVDTLIRQRRKGGVMRVSTSDVQVNVKGIYWHQHVATLADELSKLSAVSKYLPEDDRPGVLTFGLINKLSLKAELGGKFGVLHLKSSLLEGAHISVPGLMAAQISTLAVERDEEVLVSEVIPNLQDTTLMGPPMLMCRFIADEMEPTVRVKLSNSQFEYTVPTLIAIMDLLDALNRDKPIKNELSSPRSSELSSSSSDMSDFARKVRFSLAIRNSSIALNPDKNPAKGLLLLSDVVFNYGTKKHVSTAQLDLRKASILIIDDAGKIGHGLTNADHKLYFEENDQVQDLTRAGYVPVGSISNASAIIKITNEKSSDESLVDVEFRNNLFLLETCADSTQTLIQILSGLSPPSVPSPQAKYRTEIVPLTDMLASFTGNAFVTEPGPQLGLQASQMSTITSSSRARHDDGEDYSDEEEYDDDDEYAEDNHSHDDDHDDLADSYMDSELSHSTISDSVHIAPVNPTADVEPAMEESIMAHSMLDFRTDHFARKSSIEGTAHRWDSTRNNYGQTSEQFIRKSPLKIRARDMHIIWNLFDGYDWQSTRETISQAVQDIETKAISKQSRKDARSPGAEDDQSVIGDFLFNSIYIGVPATKDPRELTNAINQDLGDLVSETGSYATGTTVTAIHNNRPAGTRPKQKKLRLNRSRQHKLTFELRGVSADVIVFPQGSGEVETSVDARVHMLEIFDHVPTSTWKKFATYMHEAGERELNTSMVHIELLNVKPIADLAASEFVLKLTVLPLRLHVDQDALDFMTRFFEFKDDKIPASSTASTPPFFQRVEVNPIQLKLDFKPKRVDYGGLRSGRTTEFMNFFVLDRADMVLRRVILYGVSGLDRVGIMLNNIWSPDVRRNQLPGVLAGLAPIRSLVDVGSGVKDLIAVPIREYKKDGRIVRSIQKGALAFAKTTTTELVNLGAKLAIGTQTVLQNAEEILVPRPQQDDNDDGETKEQISLYADQPLGIVQGLRGAYASLERDLLVAKDAIIAVPGEVMASGSATGAAKAVLRQTPTIILRPAIGATKAVGQTLLGAGNTLDKGNLRRVEEKYKRHF